MYESTGGPDAGAAYVFERNPESGLWEEVAKLTASDAEERDRFGWSVSVSGTTAIVGAMGEDTGGTDAGAAYVFERNPESGLWEKVAKLTAFDSGAYDVFGYSVSVSGTTAVVGASGENTFGVGAGAAYVFERNPESGLWEDVAKFTASDAGAADHFGISVSVSETTAVVGANDEGSGGPRAGAAYVFERNPESGTWEEVVKLTASDAGAADQFGLSVSVSETTAVVGAPYEDTDEFNEGAAYVFERNPESGLWEDVAKLTASDAEADDMFGYSVSVSGTTAVVGAHGEDTGGNLAGAAYVFKRNPASGLWEEVAKLTASDAEAEDWFGRSVSVSGTTAVVGARYKEIDIEVVNAGAAYVFE